MISRLTVGDWLADAACRLLKSSGERTAEETAIESQALLAHLLQQNRAWLLAHPDYALSPNQVEAARTAFDQLAAGMPLPYLTGIQEFYALPIEVTPSVLIPRPETELLVERALAWLAKNPTSRRAADVGSGSGCIAVSLAQRVPDLRVLATDRSFDALQTARRNVRRYHLEKQIHLVQCSLLEPVNGSLDLICANLPYIPTQELQNLAVARFEPLLALDGGPLGLNLITDLLRDLPRLLSEKGLALFEIEAGQGRAAEQLARRLTGWTNIQVHNDLAGQPRLLEIDRD